MAARATFPVTMKDGTQPTVEGYLVAPGLGVHRAILLSGEQGSDWNVTHTPSGARLGGSYPTRRDAILAAEQFALLADWSLDDGAAVLLPVVKEVLAVRNRILWETETTHDKRKAKSTANLSALPEQIQEALFS